MQGVKEERDWHLNLKSLIGGGGCNSLKWLAFPKISVNWVVSIVVLLVVGKLEIWNIVMSLTKYSIIRKLVNTIQSLNRIVTMTVMIPQCNIFVCHH